MMSDDLPLNDGGFVQSQSRLAVERAGSSYNRRVSE
jgi:hypothetical protein